MATRWGGGLAVILRDWEISYRRIESMGMIEVLSFCIITSPASSIAGVLAYRSPGTPSGQLLELCDIIPDLSLRHANFIVLGDFNVHMDSGNCSLATQLADTLKGLNLVLKVCAPTHNAGLMLDLIFTNDPTLKVEAPIPLTWSDHWLVPFSLNGTLK